MGDLPPGFISLIVAIIATFSALATQRASARASRLEKQESNRVEMEKEAYERARKFDTDTISYQSNRIDELKNDATQLRHEKKELDSKIDKLLLDKLELRIQLKECEAARDGLGDP